MKLLYCEHCHDIFALSIRQLRSCECGRVKGRYIDDQQAEVSPEGIRLVISSKALPQAVEDMHRLQAETGDTAGREEYRRYGCGAIEDVWVRPNTGPGNPHMRLLYEETWQPRTRKHQFVTPANLLSEIEGETGEVDEDYQAKDMAVHWLTDNKEVT